MSESRFEIVKEWLRRAVHDLVAARSLAGSEPTVMDVSIYHCQQAAEKALKGFLVFWDKLPPRTLNLVVLLRQAAEVEPGFLTWEEAAARLTHYAAKYRYPSAPFISPDPEEIDEALDDATCIYDQVFAFLPPDALPGDGVA